MLLALQRYPAKLFYRPGCQQVTADMLSRDPTRKPTENQIPKGQIFQIQPFLLDLDISDACQDLPVRTETYKMIKATTQNDEEMQAVSALITTGWPDEAGEVKDTLKPYFHLRDQRAVLDGIIYQGPQLVIPHIYRPTILQKLHTSHQGAAATLRRARSCVYWPSMAEEIRQHVDKCFSCAMDATQQTKETAKP
ncbi:uncharacterized protein [Watersipora subatra]|uniref:uncharacterized protein n=1 Tax=Watersipora subatra TaxID=2589382 RepID=UPI00355B6BDC